MLSKAGSERRLVSRLRRLGIGVLLVAAFPALVGLVPAEPAVAAPREVVFPEPVTPERVKLSKAAKKVRKVLVRKPYERFDPSRNAAFPGAQDATVNLAPGTAAGAAGRTRAGSTPISVGRGKAGVSPGKVRIKTADREAARKAGIRGVLFSVGSAAGAGTVSVDVDDSSFRNGYGGGYASRLRLVQLPACALTTPELEKCRTQTPLRTQSSTPLSAEVDLAASAGNEADAVTAASGGSGMVLAATSGVDGVGGDYSATSLSPGGTWATSGNTGAFTYNYPITIPPSIAGVAPSVALSYSSSAQDARTAGTNNQSSWVGDGWSTSDNFIERTYKACSDIKDSGAPEGSGDLCWAGQILTLSLNGSSSQIVYDAAAKTFRPASDSSTTKIEQLTNATNGTKNNEYFRVTEKGVQYYFGWNRLPGWEAGDQETKSAWTVPVYKADAGVSACPGGSTFAGTSCLLGYRFNLDYVVDLNGNAMAYYYKPETGFYGANNKDRAVEYPRRNS